MLNVHHACLEKATLEHFLKLKRKVVPPLNQFNMTSFSSSDKSVEGYLDAVVFVAIVRDIPGCME
jgi:hypothetical protein